MSSTRWYASRLSARRCSTCNLPLLHLQNEAPHRNAANLNSAAVNDRHRRGTDPDPRVPRLTQASESRKENQCMNQCS
jgi:hypothetical protein